MRQRIRQRTDDSFFPLVEIFGGTFAVLLVLYVLVSLFSGAVRSRMLDLDVPFGPYRVEWPGGNSGYVILVFGDKVKIAETKKEVFRGHICEDNRDFVPYARQVYLAKREKLIFVIQPGGIRLFKEAHKCLRHIFRPQQVDVAWVILDDEVEKEIYASSLPWFIKGVSPRIREGGEWFDEKQLGEKERDLEQYRSANPKKNKDNR